MAKRLTDHSYSSPLSIEVTDRAGFNMFDEHRVHGGIQKIGLTTRNPHVGLRTFQSTHVISISYLEKNDTHTLITGGFEIGIGRYER